MDPVSPTSTVSSPSLTAISTFQSDLIASPSTQPPSSQNEATTAATSGQNSPDFRPSSANVHIESSSYLLEEPNLREVMLSDVGVESLLSRLKQSYQTATNISQYLKRRANYESIRYQDLKRLSKSTHESIRRTEYRQGTFLKQFDEFLSFEDRLMDSSQSFITAIQSMHEELSELAKATHKSRKSIKETALRHERNVIEAEQNAEKAKSKYYGLCDDMEKLKDPTKTKLFKSKNNAQHEQELQTKINSAESDYRSKVDTANKLRRELVATHRPHFIKDLKDQILECDAGISVQLQNLTTLNETLLLQQGFIVCPLKPSGSTTAPLSLKEVIAKIDNDLDFYTDILKIRNTKTLNRPEVKFVQHRYMTNFIKAPASLSAGTSGGAMPPPSNLRNTGTTSQFNALKPPSQQPSTTFSSTPISSTTSRTNPPAPTTAGASLGFATGAAVATAAAVPAISSAGTTSAYPNTYPNSADMLYPDEPISNTTVTPNSRHQTFTDDTIANAIPPAGANLETLTGGNTPPPTYSSSKAYVPTFGSSLDDLIAYENPPVASPIPRIVLKCVGAISRYGMAIEGIYRKTGNAEQIERLRLMFDEDSEAIDLANPQKYGIDDIHSVSGVLKLYFTQLADALLTSVFHNEFISAAEIDSDNSRREAIHTVVNQLPDNNYSVLKFLSLHLRKVAQHEAQNRMSISTLGSMWGPVLMRSESNNINEMALMGRVVETILFFCDDIFEFDDEFFQSVGYEV